MGEPVEGSNDQRSRRMERDQRNAPVLSSVRDAFRADHDEREIVTSGPRPMVVPATRRHPNDRSDGHTADHGCRIPRQRKISG